MRLPLRRKANLTSVKQLATTESKLDQAVASGQLTKTERRLIIRLRTRLQRALQSDLANDPTAHSQALGRWHQRAAQWARRYRISAHWLSPSAGR